MPFPTLTPAQRVRYARLTRAARRHNFMNRILSARIFKAMTLVLVRGAEMLLPSQNETSVAVPYTNPYYQYSQVDELEEAVFVTRLDAPEWTEHTEVVLLDGTRGYLTFKPLKTIEYGIEAGQNLEAGNQIASSDKSSGLVASQRYCHCDSSEIDEEFLSKYSRREGLLERSDDLIPSWIYLEGSTERIPVFLEVKAPQFLPLLLFFLVIYFLICICYLIFSHPITSLF